jgi:aspartyl/asparaginyl-tRNA synthetase
MDPQQQLCKHCWSRRKRLGESRVRHVFMHLTTGTRLKPSARLGTGTSVRIAGLWRPSPAGKGQSHELHARDVEILGHTDADVSDRSVVGKCCDTRLI